MNWKLIFQLSLFGLAMALATVSLIPANIEPIFWLLIFLICAYVIAKRCGGSYFLHGFVLSLVNCIWITGAHIIFHTTYLANHPQMVEMSAKMPLVDHPRLQMLVMGPVFGIAFGIILGLFAFIASKMVKKRVAGSLP
jgi:hypothetical protein